LNVHVAPAPVLDLATLGVARVVLSERRDIWCLVSARHLAWITAHRWNWGWHARTPWKHYAKRNEGKARSTVYLHREILKVIDPRADWFVQSHHADHINGNSLDNRDENLRWLTPDENRAHKLPRAAIPSLDAILAELAGQVVEVAQLAEIPF
jgi:hypothetical protein